MFCVRTNISILLPLFVETATVRYPSVRWSNKSKYNITTHTTSEDISHAITERYLSALRACYANAKSRKRDIVGGDVEGH